MNFSHKVQLSYSGVPAEVNPAMGIRCATAPSPGPKRTIRKIASTYLNEQGFNGDHVEKGLAHKDKDKTRGTYNKAEYLEPRREMMQALSDFIQSSAEKEFVHLLSHTE